MAMLKVFMLNVDMVNVVAPLDKGGLIRKGRMADQSSFIRCPQGQHNYLNAIGLMEDHPL